MRECACARLGARGSGAARSPCNLQLANWSLLSVGGARRAVSMSAEREAQHGAPHPRVRRSSKVSFKTAWIEETLEPPAPPTATVDSRSVLHEVCHRELEPRTSPRQDLIFTRLSLALDSCGC